MTSPHPALDCAAFSSMGSDTDCSGCDNAHATLADHRETEDKIAQRYWQYRVRRGRIARFFAKIYGWTCSSHTFFKRLYG
jgi:hypothetical protein